MEDKGASVRYSEILSVKNNCTTSSRSNQNYFKHSSAINLHSRNILWHILVENYRLFKQPDDQGDKAAAEKVRTEKFRKIVLSFRISFPFCLYIYI
jgi:hypothetical protein